eukprot:TRINITY_DN2461_c0_g1_i3.p1 TRINITY_DN2461_c0_g1~~TRINITY_DN2461_c0_g1_i3.p1  ORF type:complete len:649 (+),score=139.02 TRINITY_DN2461_c0_g1_i3:144-1949(+)
MEDFSSFLEEVFTIEKWKKGKELGSGSNGTVRLVTLKDDLNLAVKRIASADNEVCSQREISLHKEAHRQKLSVPYLGAVHRGRHSYVFMAPLDETHTTLHDYLKSLTGKDAEEFSPERIKICWRLVALVTDLFKHCNIAMRDLKPDNIGLFKTLLVHMDFGNGRFITLQKTESSQRGAIVIAPPETKKPGKHEYAYIDRWSLGANIMYILSSEWIGDELPGNDMDYKEMVDTAKKFAVKLNSPLGELLEGLIVTNPRKRIDVVNFAEKDHLLALLVDASRESRTRAIDKYMNKTVPTILAHMKELEVKVPTLEVHKEKTKTKERVAEPTKKAIRKKQAKLEEEEEEEELKARSDVKKRVATPMPVKKVFSDEENESDEEGNEEVNFVKTPPAAARKNATSKKAQTEKLKKTKQRKVAAVPFAFEAEKAAVKPKPKDESFPQNEEKESEEIEVLKKLLAAAKMKAIAKKSNKQIATLKPTKRDSEEESGEKNNSDEDENKENEEVNVMKTPPASARKNVIVKKAQTEQLKKTKQRKAAAVPFDADQGETKTKPRKRNPEQAAADRLLKKANPELYCGNGNCLRLLCPTDDTRCHKCDWRRRS